MKGAAQTPAVPNSNPMARGPGNGMGATPAGGKDTSRQPPAPANGGNSGEIMGAPQYDPGSSTANTSTTNPFIPYGANAGLAASQAAEGPGFGTQSFGQQGFAGVATNPDPSNPNTPNPGGAGLALQQGPSNKILTAPGGATLPPSDPTAPINHDPAQFGPTTNNINTSNVPGLVGGDALAKMTQDSRDAAYKQATGYLDPQWQNQQTALENQLANQGVVQNSEAWNKAMDDFNRQKTFAYSQAENAAVGQGNAAQAQMFGEGLSANQNQFGQNTQQAQLMNAIQGQLANQNFTQQGITNQEAQNRFNNSLSARNQGINELLLQQQNPLNMYNALNNGTGVTQPNFTSTPGSSVNPTDILSAIQQAYGGKLNAYNAQVGAANSSNSGMAAIIAALLGA